MSGTKLLVKPDPVRESETSTLVGEASPSATETTSVQTISIPHDCEPEAHLAPLSAPAPRRGREVGIDVARGLALLGMMVVHVLPAEGANGEITAIWEVSVGNASALFAVLAGVGIALTTGRTRPPSGRRMVAAASAIFVRALLIGAIGLGLGFLVSSDDASVILPYYALLFVLAIPLLRLPVRWLVALAAVVAVGMPVLSHVVRAPLPWTPEVGNLTFVDVMERPAASLFELAWIGAYPALPWLAYVCVGLAVGRSRLYARGVAAAMVVLGLGLSLLAHFGSWFLLDVLGGRTVVTEVALNHLSLQEYTDLGALGADGTLPADAAWWLAVLAPHSATPPDLIFTIGIALAVLGITIMLGRVVAPLLYPLAVAGSMPLTLYATHLLLLSSPFMPLDAGVNFAVQVVALLAFAVVWRNWFARGPLEQLLWVITSAVRRLVGPPKRGAHVRVD